MALSMTGYGRHSMDSTLGELAWELRSVNHRYLELSIRLPDELRSIEPEVRKQVTARLHRGKVDVSLRLHASNSTALPITINPNAVEVLAIALSDLKNSLPDVALVDPVKVLQWPGVVRASDQQQDAAARQAIAGLEPALDDFIGSREREGLKTAEQLRNRNTQISAFVALLRKIRPAVVARQRDRLMSKLAELDIQHDPHRLEQELVFTAQRLDVDEELDRLDNHVTELEKALSRSGPVGRRLDFLMQELNREANTLGAKAADADTTNACVDVKVLIEQMREQVQNLE